MLSIFTCYTVLVCLIIISYTILFWSEIVLKLYILYIYKFLSYRMELNKRNTYNCKRFVKLLNVSGFIDVILLRFNSLKDKNTSIVKILILVIYSNRGLVPTVSTVRNKNYSTDPLATAFIKDLFSWLFRKHSIAFSILACFLCQFHMIIMHHA